MPNVLFKGTSVELSEDINNRSELEILSAIKRLDLIDCGHNPLCRHGVCRQLLDYLAQIQWMESSDSLIKYTL